jgi:MFS family permease
MTGMAIAALEATVVGTAMPTVIATLGGINHYSWVFSAYLLTSTVTVPVWGKLSDLYGRRIMYQIGIGVFLLGTLLSEWRHRSTSSPGRSAAPWALPSWVRSYAFPLLSLLYGCREPICIRAMWSISAEVGTTC